MKCRVIMLAGALLLAASLHACRTTAPAPGTVDTATATADISSEKGKRSYSIGLNAARNMKKRLEQLPVLFNMKMTRKGIDDALTDVAPMLSEDELKTALVELQQELMAQQQAGTRDNSGKNAEDPASDKVVKRSYGIGLNSGRNLKKRLETQLIEVDLPLIRRGIDDAFTGAKPLLGDEEVQTLITALQNESSEKQKALIEKQKALMEQQRNKKKIESEKNRKEGEAFLLKNKKQKGVRTLRSGLQYKVLVPGNGKLPKPTDIVHVQYRGTLIDGTEFDSSFKRGQAAVFPVNGVIRGWTEALLKMREGSKWMLYIPGELAYGENGNPPMIGPNAVLIFEMELISIARPKRK